MAWRKWGSRHCCDKRPGASGLRMDGVRTPATGRESGAAGLGVGPRRAPRLRRYAHAAAGLSKRMVSAWPVAPPFHSLTAWRRAFTGLNDGALDAGTATDSRAVLSTLKVEFSRFPCGSQLNAVRLDFGHRTHSSRIIQADCCAGYKPIYAVGRSPELGGRHDCIALKMRMAAETTVTSTICENAHSSARRWFQSRLGFAVRPVQDSTRYPTPRSADGRC